ncbi:AraC family transcriptional regulator [Natronosporangium hydrolyticum]|uniref:AraC family transcriptional regulator n=1 Tax=Natronosporangium hydrolyticum TaxID=2811111 RepID=A0A895YK34_9ACTN|nr:AraC family transcriptional regulator [Natronosporangium hydrolyticum]QSB14976.1 AraC family transcriptional regulator [Natronosporangium hydrolyticum]
MDLLASLLHEVRSTGALFGRTLLHAPWAVRFADRAPLTLLTMVRGDGWLIPDGAEPLRLHAHDVAVVVGPEPFTVTHEPGTPLTYTVQGPGQCITADGGDVSDQMGLGGRTCGEGLDAPYVLLAGGYPVQGTVSQRLLSTLPRVLVVPECGEPCPVLDLAVAEIDREVPGQQAVLDRLLDLLLLSTLREWFTQPAAHPPAWYRASTDPSVGPVLRLIHETPSRPWSVASLAREAGVSRATFARRFREVLGQPPMAYLAQWRLSQAADLLERSEYTVDAIARQVGYANGYALSVAFTREFGVRPSEHRARFRRTSMPRSWSEGPQQAPVMSLSS